VGGHKRPPCASTGLGSDSELVFFLLTPSLSYIFFVGLPTKEKSVQASREHAWGPDGFRLCSHRGPRPTSERLGSMNPHSPAELCCNDSFQFPQSSTSFEQDETKNSSPAEPCPQTSEILESTSSRMFFQNCFQKNACSPCDVARNVVHLTRF